MFDPRVPWWQFPCVCLLAKVWEEVNLHSQDNCECRVPVQRQGALMPPECLHPGPEPAGARLWAGVLRGAPLQVPPSLAQQECAQQLSLKGNMRKTSCFREIFNMFFIFGRQLMSGNVLLLPGQHD